MKTSLLLLAYGLQINQDHKQLNNGIHQEPICYLFIYLLTYLFIKFISITNLTKSVWINDENYCFDHRKRFGGVKDSKN